MYGHIHSVVKDLVLSKFGQEAWDIILKEAGVEEREHFMLFYHYDDTIVLKLVGAASKCLNLPAETVLEVFGDYFLMHCLRYGYDDMLRTLGSDMTSFIQNLDSLHSLLALTYDKMVAPSFRCETNDDGSLTLHYYSARTGLHPLVKGVVRAVGREIFQQEVELSLLSQNTEQLDEERSQYHAVFHVTIIKKLEEGRPRPEGLEIERAGSKDDAVIENPIAPVTLTKDQFVSAFPYHLIFDEGLRLHQFGCSVAKLSPVPLREGMRMDTCFRVLYPRMSFTVPNIRRFINAIFVISVDAGNDSTDEHTFSMKGQMIWMDTSKLMIFIGSPRLTSLKEMKRMNVYMADIPLYDVTREMVLLYQQRNAEIDITKKLDETTAELKRTSRALELEQQKTERLLYQMLPQKVADQLKNGEKVEAEKFDQVTILFSDIVTFTNIAAACTPLDIVNMLNDMYHRFDLKTTVHGVYKVETIGDAYMVVSGVPEKTDQHAQPVANFALDMVEQAGCVLSPATGKPLQIRVGIHTGPVVAGVVGLKMPRYCLFGDTVNTASRMESHGIPGRIHLSPTTYKALQGHGYKCKSRGETNIKGKGMMNTYFLIGSKDHVITEPEDEHLSLPMIRENETETEGKVANLETDRSNADGTSDVSNNPTALETHSACKETGVVNEKMIDDNVNKKDTHDDGDDSKNDENLSQTTGALSLRDIPISSATLNHSPQSMDKNSLKQNGQTHLDSVSVASDTGNCPSSSRTCQVL